MSHEEIVATVNTILTKEFELKPERLSPDARLIDDLELDSLDAVDLIAALETELGGRVAEDKARAVRTVGDVYALVEHEVERRLGGGGAGGGGPDVNRSAPS
jgi:acyl carrier protein